MGFAGREGLPIAGHERRARGDRGGPGTGAPDPAHADPLQRGDPPRFHRGSALRRGLPGHRRDRRIPDVLGRRRRERRAEDGSPRGPCGSRGRLPRHHRRGLGRRGAGARTDGNGRPGGQGLGRPGFPLRAVAGPLAGGGAAPRLRVLHRPAHRLRRGAGRRPHHVLGRRPRLQRGGVATAPDARRGHRVRGRLAAAAPGEGAGGGGARREPAVAPRALRPQPGRRPSSAAPGTACCWTSTTASSR